MQDDDMQDILNRPPSDFGDQATAGKVAAVILIAALLACWVAFKGCADMPEPGRPDAAPASIISIIQSEEMECGE